MTQYQSLDRFVQDPYSFQQREGNSTFASVRLTEIVKDFTVVEALSSGKFFPDVGGEGGVFYSQKLPASVRFGKIGGVHLTEGRSVYLVPNTNPELILVRGGTYVFVANTYAQVPTDLNENSTSKKLIFEPNIDVDQRALKAGKLPRRQVVDILGDVNRLGSIAEAEKTPIKAFYVNQVEGGVVLGDHFHRIMHDIYLSTSHDTRWRLEAVEGNTQDIAVGERFEGILPKGRAINIPLHVAHTVYFEQAGQFFGVVRPHFDLNDFHAHKLNWEQS